MKRKDIHDEIILDLPEHRKNVARYMWSVFSAATYFPPPDANQHPLEISSGTPFPISHSFDDLLQGKISRVAERYDLPQGLADFRKNEPIACAFYLLNSLHEWNLPREKFDKYGRYPFQESIQYTHNAIEENLVQTIFNDIYQQITGNGVKQRNSELFWSHDIDYLHSAWKTDLILAKRNLHWVHSPKKLWQALTTPHRWNNILEILDLEKKYDIRSVFFWLTRQGKSRISDFPPIDHADYHFQNPETKAAWDAVTEANSLHGIHKSAFESSLNDEIAMLPGPVQINRNHFLKFRLPEHYQAVEKSGLKYDASLGFAEHYGFRNSFGRPFRPYNLKKDRPHSFVEYPLHLMDATFFHYFKNDLPTMIRQITDFAHRHRFNTTLGILIHNSSFDFTNPREMEIWGKLYESLRGFERALPS